MTCHAHPDRPATSQIYAGGPKLCYECTQEIIRATASRRAYGTGLGPEAHAEAQESGYYQELEKGMRRQYTITRGGKPE